MEINKIVARVNDKLAGELLTYDSMKYLLDAVIDDINDKLEATFPVFTDFTNTYSQYPNYNFFPDKYIRTVVVAGAAHKFYNVDEEGVLADPELKLEYTTELFKMERYYVEQVLTLYQKDPNGCLVYDEDGIYLGENAVEMSL